LYSWDDPVNAVQFPVSDPAWMSNRIKEVGRFYGADLIGITKIDQRWVYSHSFERATGNYERLEIHYKYAIVMGIEMDWQRIDQSPKPGASAATALAYSQMAELSASLAKYIRALGYPAVPCGNDSAQSIPLAIDAGLGELGRNGLLISPEFGPRQRICKVFTDLPLQPDQPIDFGMRSFCETCHACAAACPANAIRWEERTAEQTSISNRTGILRWPVNVASCYLFWMENGVDCSNCVAACPWALHSQRDWLEL
jgi:epoxyqueuosine reductase